jgi:hypothetical protein
MTMDYRAMAREEALKAGVDPDVFERLVQNESSFNPSPPDAGAGAVGLSQLLPSTARGLGVDPYDPRQNLQGGANYLKQQYDRYGDYYNAAAAYTAGPGNVDQGNVNAEQRAYAQRVSGAVGIPAGGAPAGGGMSVNPNRMLSGMGQAPGDQIVAPPQDFNIADVPDDATVDTSDTTTDDQLTWMQQMEDEQQALQEQQDLQAELSSQYGGTDGTDTTGLAPGDIQIDAGGGGPVADPTTPTPGEPTPGDGSRPRPSADVISALLGGSGTTTGLNQAQQLDRIGVALYGVPYGGATAAQKAAMLRTLGKIDEQSLIQFGVPFGQLPPNADPKHPGKSQVEILKTMKADAVVPTESEAKASAAQALSNARHAEALKLFDQRRTALWARQDALREAALQRAQNQAFIAASVKQPTAEKAPPAAKAPGAGNLSFTSLAAAIPADTLSQLVSAWQGGSLGISAVAPLDLQRMMASLPIADTAADFLATLQHLWVKDGMPTPARQSAGRVGTGYRLRRLPTAPQTGVRRSAPRR